MRMLLIAVAVVGLALAAGCRQSEPAHHPAEAKPAAKAPSAAGQPAIAQKMCPVMGMLIDPNVHADHNGRRIYFCCTSCLKAFEKDPAKYVAKVDEQLKGAGGTPAEAPPMEMPAEMPHKHH